MLQSYFGDRMKYSERYKRPVRPEHNVVKTHDFKLNESWKGHNKIVLIRHPEESIVSFWKLFFPKGNEDDWKRFSLEKLRYWEGFVKKWKMSKAPIFIYRRILSYPIPSFASIVETISRERVNMEKLREAIKKEAIRPLPNAHRGFEFMTDVFRMKAEEAALKYLNG